MTVTLCQCCKHRDPLKCVCPAYPNEIPEDVCTAPCFRFEKKGNSYPSNCNGSGIGFEPKEWYVKHKERVAYCEAHGIPMVDD